jgi:hypothetical protein
MSRVASSDRSVNPLGRLARVLTSLPSRHFSAPLRVSIVYFGPINFLATLNRLVRMRSTDRCAFEILAIDGAACGYGSPTNGSISDCAITGDARAATAVAAMITFRLVLIVDLAVVCYHSVMN